MLILPNFYGLKGIWYSFTIADVASAAVCFFFLRIGINKMMKRWDNQPVEPQIELEENLVD